MVSTWSDDQIRQELRKLSTPPPVAAPSRFAPTQEAPKSRFASIAQTAKKGFLDVLSGESFLVDAGLVNQSTFDNMNPISRFAIDNLASPIGLASLIAAPFTGGGSIAAKTGLAGALAGNTLGKAALRTGVEIGGQAAVDLAISGLATGAAKTTDYALRDANPTVRTIGTLTAGLLAGAAGGRTLGKIINPSVAEGARSGARLAAEDISLPDSVNIIELAGGLKGGVPRGLGGIMSAIDPSQNVTTTLGKVRVAYEQAITNGNKTDANTWLVAKFGQEVQDMLPNSKGEILIGDTFKPIREAFDPSNYDLLSPKYKASVNRITLGLAEAVDTRNVYAPANEHIGLFDALNHNWRFDTKGNVVYSNDARFRDIETTAIQNRFNKNNIERPDAILFIHGKTALDRQAQYQYHRANSPYFRSADEVYANSAEGRAKYAEMVSDQQRVDAMRDNYEQVIRREKAASAARRGDINTTRGIKRDVVQEIAQNKQALEDMLYKRVWSPRAGQITDPFEGETGQEKGLRLLVEEITGVRSQVEPIGNPGSMVKYGPIGRKGEVGVQSAMPGFDVPPVSTFTEPVVPKVPHTIRQLLTDGKEELKSLKAEEKILAKGRSVANKLFYQQSKGDVVNQSAVNRHLADRLAIEKRIFDLQDRRAELEARLEQLGQINEGVKLQRISGTKPADIARYKLQNAEYNSRLTSQEWANFKKTTVIEEASSKLFDIPGEEYTGKVSKVGEAFVFERQQDLDEIAKWVKSTGHGGEPAPGIGKIQQGADLQRFLQSSLDLSGAFINLLPMMFSQPKAWGKALAANWSSVLLHTSPGQVKQQIEYLQNEDNYRIILKMAQHNLIPGDMENFVSAARGGLINKLNEMPGIGKAMDMTFGRMQRGYEFGLLVGRVESWKSMEGLTGITDQVIAKHIKEISGAMDTGSMGVAPTQRELESIVLFSPRLFRSTMALMGDAIRPWTPEGQLAAHTVLKMLAAGAGMFAVANAGIGMLSGENDEQISKRITEAMDPTLGRQFLSVKVGDQYYGIGGTVRAMTQAIAKGITNSDEGRGNPIWQFLANRQGPAIRAATTLVEAATGDDWAPYMKVDNIMDWTEAQAQSLLPFYVQNMLNEGSMPGGPMLVDIAGLSSRARTATDILDSEAYQRHNRPWNDLSDSEQAAIKVDHPELEKKAEQLLTKEKVMFNDAIKSVNDTTNNDLLAINSMTTTATEKRKRIQEVLRDRWVQNKRLYETFNLASNNKGATSDAQRVTEAYFKTFEDASLSGGTQTDWTKWEEYQTDLKKRITSGEFGDPQRAQQILDERSKFKLPPELAWYDDASAKVKATNYWGQKDVAFNELRNLIQGSFPQLDSARSLDVALDNAPDPVTQARLKALSKVLEARTSDKRKLLKAKDKELVTALKALGY